MNFIVPIIIASEKDIKLANDIQKIINLFKIDSIIRISSPHNSSMNLIQIINDYETNNDVKVYITIDDKYNTLTDFFHGNAIKPVISSQLYSDNTALAAIKICALFQYKLQSKIAEYKQNIIIKLHLNDVINKYHNIIVNKSVSTSTFLSISTASMETIKYAKVRDVYIKRDHLLLTTTDRLIAFNRYITTIPFKGEVLHRINYWWFEKTKHLVPNHVINNESNDKCVLKVKKCTVFPIQFFMRSYLTNTTSTDYTETSMWKKYEDGLRICCGLELPHGMLKNQKLDKPILIPINNTKKDELICKKCLLEQNIMTREQWDICEKYSFMLFEYGQKVSKKNGLILVDTKYEFGLDDEDNVILVDELHTPENTTYWIDHSYLEKFKANLQPEYIDKDYIKKWIKFNYDDPYDENIEISVPQEIVNDCSFKYLQLYELITGFSPLITYEDNDFVTVKL